jgi:hypothetical protein
MPNKQQKKQKQGRSENPEQTRTVDIHSRGNNEESIFEEYPRLSGHNNSGTDEHHGEKVSKMQSIIVGVVFHPFPK